MTKTDKTLKRLADKADGIDLALRGERETRARQIIRAEREAHEALQEAQKARKHAQTNQETLVQHATAIGELRKQLTEHLERQSAMTIQNPYRIDCLEKQLNELASYQGGQLQGFDDRLKAIDRDINHDRHRLEQLERFANELHNRISDLEPKDVDPRQNPEPDPPKAPPEVMQQMGRTAQAWSEGPPEAPSPEQQWVPTAFLQELERRTMQAERARDEALAWQERTAVAKQQALDELDAMTAEYREARAQRNDYKEQAEAGEETVQRLERQLNEAQAEVERQSYEMNRLLLRDQQRADDDILRPKWLASQCERLQQVNDRLINFLGLAVQQLSDPTEMQFALRHVATAAAAPFSPSEETSDDEREKRSEDTDPDQPADHDGGASPERQNDVGS